MLHLAVQLSLVEIAALMVVSHLRFSSSAEATLRDGRNKI